MLVSTVDAFSVESRINLLEYDPRLVSIIMNVSLVWSQGIELGIKPNWKYKF